LGRILSLDIGEVRIGLAIGDITNQFAQPYDVINRRPEKLTFEKLKEIIKKNDIEKIIVGLPLKTDGTIGTQAENTIKFCDKLKNEIPIPIEMYDERFSSKIAEDLLIKDGMRRENRKKVQDKIASAIILQSYLDSNAQKKDKSN